MSTTIDHPSHGTIGVRTYLIVFAALMVLLVLTVLAAFIELPGGAPVGLGVALVIATAKMLLVILYFMHVIHSSRLTQVFVAAAFLWLGVLLALTYGDYLTRGWLTPSRGWTENPAVVPDDRAARPTAHP